MNVAEQRKTNKRKRQTYLTVCKRDDAAQHERAAPRTRPAPSARTASGSAVKATSHARPTYSAPCPFPLGKSCSTAPGTTATLPVQLQCPQRRQKRPTPRVRSQGRRHPQTGGKSVLRSAQKALGAQHQRSAGSVGTAAPGGRWAGLREPTVRHRTGGRGCSERLALCYTPGPDVSRSSAPTGPCALSTAGGKLHGSPHTPQGAPRWGLRRLPTCRVLIP